MPYIKAVKRHECKQPDAKKINKRFDAGTLWQCPTCKKVYRLENDQRDGWIWIETKEKL
jgi:ribosomal protein L37AE/L43A